MRAESFSSASGSRFALCIILLSVASVYIDAFAAAAEKGGKNSIHATVCAVCAVNLRDIHQSKQRHNPPLLLTLFSKVQLADGLDVLVHSRLISRVLLQPM
jgi:hypothetical protein